MPVTKTAKRALRSSLKKRAVNQKVRARLDAAIRNAKKKKTGKAVKEAISMTDKAAKKNVIHDNKAARIKSKLTKLAKITPGKKKKSKKKTSKKKSKKTKKK